MLSRARLLLGCCLILLSSCAALSSEDQSHTNEVMPPSLTRSKPERAAPSKAAEASLKQNDVVQAAVDTAHHLLVHELAPMFDIATIREIYRAGHHALACQL
ncbi:MAG: hypothetical protein ACXVCI_08885, partial [Bdellovibrionota bacterium]